MTTKRPNVDESLCFICQDLPPIWEAIRDPEKPFHVCQLCRKRIEAEIRTYKALLANDTLHIFTYTLGAKVAPSIRFKRLPV